MSKMFRCDNGTMFSIDEVLSIKEAATYYDKLGNKIKPDRIFSSEKEMKDEMPNASRMGKTTFWDCVGDLMALPFLLVVGLIWFILWLVCSPILRIFGMSFPRLSSSDAEIDADKKRWIEDDRKQDPERWKVYIEEGVLHLPSGEWTVRQWDVTLRNQQKKIHIFDSDYERLRAEMGK